MLRWTLRFCRNHSEPTPLSKHRDLPFPLSCCFCPMLWFLFQTLVTGHLPPCRPSPNHQGRQPRLQLVPGEPSSELTQLWWPHLAAGFPAWNIGSAAIGPCPNKTRLLANGLSWSLWPKFQPLSPETPYSFLISREEAQEATQEVTECMGTFWPSFRKLLLRRVCAHFPGVHSSSSRHSSLDVSTSCKVIASLLAHS